MKIINVQFDRQVAIFQSDLYAEQKEDAEALEEEWSKIKSRNKTLSNRIQALLAGNRTRGVLVGEKIITTFQSVSNAVSRNAEYLASERMCVIAYQLQLFHRQNGKYPATLETVLTDSKTNLLDPFSGKPIIYTRRDTGFRLHVVGDNLKDDDAVNGEDRSQGMLGDDLKIDFRPITKSNKR